MWDNLEKNGEVWVRREIDEIGSSNWTQESGGGSPSIRGEMIGGHNLHNEKSLRITKKIDKALPNFNFVRIA